MSPKTLILTAAALTLAAALPALAQQDGDADSRESYSYVRVLDGSATLASENAGPGEEAEVNQPLMTGDRVTVARGARLEIALADRNLLRVGGDSALTLASIAFSGDRGERSTRIDLDEGEIILVVTDAALGDSLPEIRTPQAEVVIHRPGTYRVESRTDGWTEVVVRDGFAEVVTSLGSTVVREGESAWTSDGRQDVDVADAGSFDALERWSDDLGQRAERARGAVLHVEPELAYTAEPLADYGSWISVDAGWYWRPRVEVGWRPYWRGRWGWTPSGLTWISSEPWGWLPYHYGTWVVLPGYGWVWQPGRVYAPAWVYWHWTDSWVGWCPTGYYTGWYGDGWGYDGFRWGVYGWAGGGWGSYYDWNFVPTNCLRRHDQRPWMRRGHDLEHELGPRMPRGVLTTDTRGLPRDRFTDPGVGTSELLRRVTTRRNGDLPDVSDFVARKRELPPRVIEAVRPDSDTPVRVGGPSGDRDFNPRFVPPTTGSGRRGGSEPGERVEGRNALPRDGRLFDRGRPSETGVPPARGGSDLEPRRTTRPPASDVDRPTTRGSSDRGQDQGRRTAPPTRTAPPPSRTAPPAPPTRTVPPPSSGRLEPGGAVEIDGSGRVNPVGRYRPQPPTADDRRVAPPQNRGTWDAPPAGAPGSGDRQGWRGRERWSGTPATSAPTYDSPSYPAPRYEPRQDEPVQRVLGGVRRNDGGAQGSTAPRWSPPQSSPGSGYSPAEPRWTPRSAPPARSAPGYTAPGATPRVSPTPSAPSRPSASPPSRPSSPPASSGSRTPSRSDSPPPRGPRGHG